MECHRLRMGLSLAGLGGPGQERPGRVRLAISHSNTHEWMHIFSHSVRSVLWFLYTYANVHIWRPLFCLNNGSQLKLLSSLLMVLYVGPNISVLPYIESPGTLYIATLLVMYRGSYVAILRGLYEVFKKAVPIGLYGDPPFQWKCVDQPI